VYANLVGGQDELVFDGGSFVLGAGPAGPQVLSRLPAFKPALACVDIHLPMQDGCNASVCPVYFDVLQPSVMPASQEAQVYQALCLGVRDYVHKNRFPGVLIGLSGGVDSALTLAIAVDALGAERVHTIMMPSPYTAEISWLDARAMVARLGVHYEEVTIEPCMQTFASSLTNTLLAARQQAVTRGHAPGQDTTAENIQARIRGTMLMAVSNSTGYLVLTTGNKSELATGYCTLYGDMAGGFSVLKDVFKTWVYRLCAYRNQMAVAQGLLPVIPERIVNRPPSAELRPNQRDDDSLPPYATLDAILALYMEQNQSVESIVAAGFDPADVLRAVRLLRINEYKRRQAPVGIRVSHRAFGRDWRYPISSGFDDTLALTVPFLPKAPA
jgi:NAD+ synthase (glutamine-hydrolysing)